MGKGYLIDSNVIVDFFDDTLPVNGKDLLNNIDPIISIVTFIEIFSKKSLSAQEINKLNEFSEFATIYDVDRNIALITIDLRTQCNIKLPDAIIAATAVFYELILITRNVSDFNKIRRLEVLNPYKI